MANGTPDCWEAVWLMVHPIDGKPVWLMVLLIDGKPVWLMVHLIVVTDERVHFGLQRRTQRTHMRLEHAPSLIAKTDCILHARDAFAKASQFLLSRQLCCAAIAFPHSSTSYADSDCKICIDAMAPADDVG